MLYPAECSTNNLYYEKEMRSIGFNIIAGVDEVGRGCLAGPVVACAVIMPADVTIKGINDSKLLSCEKREALFSQIINLALSYAFGLIEPEEIDRINIRNASLKAMHHAVKGLNVVPSCILVDGNASIPSTNIPQKTIIKGDKLSHTISCASILAKVHRDNIMKQYHAIYPEYKFSIHKGYGTNLHKIAIKKSGITPIHRKSFKLF
jgi:ribonuclease HII